MGAAEADAFDSAPVLGALAAAAGESAGLRVKLSGESHVARVRQRNPHRVL